MTTPLLTAGTIEKHLALPMPTFTPLRIFSDGAGTNSVAALVLQAQGKINFDAFVFANVGEDSENPETLAYRKEYIEPFAAKHGIKLVERQKMYKGQLDTVYSATLSERSTIPIPVVFPGRGFGNRSCTQDFKVEVVNKYIRSETPATHTIIGIGFSAEERARVYKKYPYWHDRQWTRDKQGVWKPAKKTLGYWRMYEFPLVNLNLNRSVCEAIIAEAGLPPVPKSACWFCPFTGRAVWVERKQTNNPVLPRAIQFQNDVNKKYSRLHANNPKASDWVAIHRDGIPLEQIPDQASLWDLFADQDESCQTECGAA